MGVHFDTNSKGLRDREFSYEKPSESWIMMLGDLFTVGWGAKFDETFPKRIERMYADRGIQSEVINTGVGTIILSRRSSTILRRATSTIPTSLC